MVTQQANKEAINERMILDGADMALNADNFDGDCIAKARSQVDHNNAEIGMDNTTSDDVDEWINPRKIQG
jgi:hypothetical protein